MKKFTKFLAMTLASSMLFSGCNSVTPKEASAASKVSASSSDTADTGSGNSSNPTVINLYSSGSDNVRACWDKVIAAYEAQNKTNITVKLQFLPSGDGNLIDKIEASVKAGQKMTDMDIVEFGSNDVERLLKSAGQDSLSTLTEKEVPNMKNLAAKSVIDSDKTMEFRGTTVVLAYNSAKIPNPPKTIDDLYAWIKAHPQRFAYNDPNTGGSGNSFVTTAIYNQLPTEAASSDDKKWEDQWNKGFDILKELHPFMYQSSGKIQYPQKNQGTLDLLASGEVDIIPAWADMALQQISNGELPSTTKICQISPAFDGDLVQLVVPTSSNKKDAAYDFLNYVLSPEAQGIFVKEQAAIPVIKPEMLSPDTMKILTGFSSTDFRIINNGALSKDLTEDWQNQIATLN